MCDMSSVMSWILILISVQMLSQFLHRACWLTGQLNVLFAPTRMIGATLIRPRRLGSTSLHCSLRCSLGCKGTHPFACVVHNLLLIHILDLIIQHFGKRLPTHLIEFEHLRVFRIKITFVQVDTGACLLHLCCKCCRHRQVVIDEATCLFWQAGCVTWGGSCWACNHLLDSTHWRLSTCLVF